jgi:hypothetical protein
MKRVRAGKQFGRTIGRVVVSEPSDAPKRAGRPRSLEVLALNCERQTRSPGQRQTHRPDFEVNPVDLAWLERLALAKLAQANELATQGKLQSEIARTLGVSVMTLHRWHKAPPGPQPVSVATPEAKELHRTRGADDGIAQL